MLDGAKTARKKQSPAVQSIPLIDTPKARLKFHSQSPPTRKMPSPAEACLRVPTFLGVHTLALSEELTLDGGALRVWTGAAEHHDPAADSATQLLAEQQRHSQSQPLSRSQLLQGGGAFGGGGALEARADQVFCSPPASGHRVLGGPFLRAALPSFDSASANTAAAGLLHVWLAAGGPRSLTDGGAGGGGAGGGGAGGAIQRLGPYRLHVLSTTIGKTGDESAAGGATGDSLQASETLTVTVAVDKLAGEAEAADAVRLTLTLDPSPTRP